MNSKKQPTTGELATLAQKAVQAATRAMYEELAASGHDPRKLQQAAIDGELDAIMRALAANASHALQKAFGLMN